MTTTTTTNTTTTTTTNNCIITLDFHGKTADDMLKKTISMFERHERDAFNIALGVAYATGVTIPAYTDKKGNAHPAATCDKPMTQQDFVLKFQRAKGTISKWVSAMEYIINNDLFNAVASGLIPFYYEKINLIFDERYADVFKEYHVADLLNMSKTSLEEKCPKSLKKSKKSKKSEKDTSTADATSEDETIVSFTYNGKTFTCSEKAINNFIEKHAKVKIVDEDTKTVDADMAEDAK